MNIKHLQEMRKKHGCVELTLFSDGSSSIGSYSREIVGFDTLEELERHLTPTEADSARCFFLISCKCFMFINKHLTTFQQSPLDNTLLGLVIERTHHPGDTTRMDYMGINLGCFYAFVPGHLLDCSDVIASLEKMGTKAVA